MNVQSTSAAWLAAIEQREEIGTILHLGAGWGNELAACLETGAREVVLVEPNADFLSALEREAENNPRVRLLPVAVSAKPGRAPFHLLNFSSRSSLNVPTGLSEIFPGLREVAEVVVETLSIDQILERLALDVDASHVLIVDCPGAEHVVLDSLLSIDRMLQFRHVFLYGAKEIMYDGSRSIDELVALLEKHGYQVEGRDTTDPDFPGFRMRLDPLSLDNARLGAQLQQTLIETETLRAEVAARNDRIAQLEKALTEARDEATGIGGARADIEAMLEAANGRLAVRDIRVAELETALDQARSMAEFAGKACGEAETRLKAETDRLAERDIEIAELERALTVVREAAADVGKTRVEAEARLAEVSSRLAARDGLVTELEKALAEARTLVEASGQACSASEARLKEESSRLAAREAELEKALAEARAAAHAAGKARSETESRLKEESVKLAARDGRVAELEKQLGESRAAAE
ncbi:MAG: FkbM family methyltransferase, partial [Pseudorhodoplanes sp.]